MEALTCRRLANHALTEHPNVLPLLGVTMIRHRFVMASKWMTGGNVKCFLKEHPHVNRLELVCSVPFMVLARY